MLTLAAQPVPEKQQAPDTAGTRKRPRRRKRKQKAPGNVAEERAGQHYEVHENAPMVTEDAQVDGDLGSAAAAADDAMPQAVAAPVFKAGDTVMFLYAGKSLQGVLHGRAEDDGADAWGVHVWKRAAGKQNHGGRGGSGGGRSRDYTAYFPKEADISHTGT
eukprot:CAMPEP_0172912500 /NCGR_PEP_ID=MMETSP1075-20121228/188527_1 /TAXON_ID=2916 /ORGANISM="Ceratium fusus, Strain PA161109" /LENGTH=160 /DNA_ID=CAMNT_0013771011 /DNA_START=114 /DNA_END=596 /DNA_ORIENTATION=+